jgi:hypothetical protein
LFASSSTASSHTSNLQLHTKPHLRSIQQSSITKSRTTRPRATNNLPSERYQGRASFASEPPSRNKREEMAEDTLSRIPAVLHDQGITQPDATSTFFDTQLESLEPEICPGHAASITVRHGDTFALAREISKVRPDYHCKTTDLNCASDAELAGGWRHRLGTTQEDVLCYSSTLFPTLERRN